MPPSAASSAARPTGSPVNGGDCSFSARSMLCTDTLASAWRSESMASAGSSDTMLDEVKSSPDSRVHQRIVSGRIDLQLELGLGPFPHFVTPRRGFA